MTAGEVPGATAHERAVFVAGVLAERGVTGLTLRPGDGPELVARRTDLPAIIESAPVGAVLESRAPGIRILVGAAGLRWESDDPGFVQAFSPGG